MRPEILDLLKLSAVLALIILLVRLKWNLGLVLVLASVATGFLFGLAPQELIVDMLGAVVEPLTLRLVAIVLLITFMGEMLRSTLQLEGLVTSLGDLFVDRRWLLALFPSLIGLLPMVGGAMFSAPMVDEASQGMGISQERKTFVNYWFRHMWESIFPLYPSLIVAAALMGVTVQVLTRTQWPLFLAVLAGGILFGMFGIKNAPDRGGSRPGRGQSLLLLLKSIWPIILVLGLAILLGVDLILSLVVTIAALIIAYRPRPRELWAVIRRVPLGTVPIIVGTMIFRSVLETSGAIEATSRAFTNLGIPLSIIVYTVPLLAGLFTGLSVAAFAVGFPIVLPLCGPDLISSGCGLLAFCGAYVGILISPVHLCLALTRTYFQAEWGGIYRRIAPAAILLTATAVAVVLLKT